VGRRTCRWNVWFLARAQGVKSTHCRRSSARLMAAAGEQSRHAVSYTRRSQLTAILGLVAGNVAVVTLAYASLAAPVALPTRALERAYDLTIASDRDLLEYDRSHPECDLWTDWRKLCSRMGPNGATTCTVDTHHPAKASAPFCADSKLGHRDMRAEAASRSRFCAKWRVPEFDRTSGKVERDCEFYKVERPFNGARVETLATPYCLKWLGPRNRYSPLSCTLWSSNVACSDPIGGAEPPTDNGGASMLIDTPTLQIVRPVWGTYCHTMY
jgi:hypothetical protein